MAKYIFFTILIGSVLIVGVCNSKIISITVEVEPSHKVTVDKIPIQIQNVNERPIIGVLSQEIDEDIMKDLPVDLRNTSTSYIASSYIKWVETGGARAVPVIIGREESYYQALFKQLNGLLLPGGNAPLVGKGGYAEVGQQFFEMAKQDNDEGDFFPIWGTCNGFELLTVLSSNDDTSRLTSCNSMDQASPLHLIPKWEGSGVLGMAPPDVIQELTEEQLTINFHHFCLTPANFTKYGLDKFWNPLTYNFDIYDLEYLSFLEAKKYPFIATQFHPEKNIFEWSLKEPMIPHSSAAIHVSLYFATHFVNMARRSTHRFNDRATEESFLIYNFSPIYTGKMGVDSTFQEIYAF